MLASLISGLSNFSIHHYLSQQQDVSILVFMHLCLHTFPFSPTSSMTSYSPPPLSVATTDCKYSCVYASKCLHTFPFSPTSSTTSYSPLSVTTTGCKYSCVYASMSSYISFFTYFLHNILFTTICHNNRM